MSSTLPTKRTLNVVFRDDETTIGRQSRERNSPEIWKSCWSEACSPSGGVGGGLWGLRPPATKWGTKGGSPRWFVTYHGSVSDELLLFIFFILIHGDGDWFFLERFFVFYQSIESLISQSFSVFHIGDRVIIHDFIKVSSSTFFNPGGCTPHEIHIWTWGEVGGSWKLILEWMNIHQWWTMVISRKTILWNIQYSYENGFFEKKKIFPPFIPSCLPGVR